MSDDARRALREVQEHFRLPSIGLVEKDLYVVKAIAALAAIDAALFTLVFGGGTAPGSRAGATRYHPQVLDGLATEPKT